MQQAFSYENTLSLHAGILALDQLHEAWSKPFKRTKFSLFYEALDAAYCDEED